MRSLLLLLAGLGAPALAATSGQLFHNPSCGCCHAWAAHMQANGLPLQAQARTDMTTLKQQWGVPAALQSCHTAKLGGYLIEGHVPAAQVQRLLKEKPAIAGLAVAGMPAGSPGMEAAVSQPYQVVAFTRDGRQYVYASIPGSR